MKSRGQVEYDAQADFDRQELWRVRLVIQSSQGSGEATTQVEVTPPGFGRWDLLLYLLPFLLRGILVVHGHFAGAGGASRRKRAAEFRPANAAPAGDAERVG